MHEDITFDPPAGSIIDSASLEQWLSQASTESSPNLADQVYAYSHPRVQFIKTLPYNTTLIDAGAGDGGLINFKNWLEPNRLDLTFFGTSLSHAGLTTKYDEFVESYITSSSPTFSKKADALMACHLVEHLESPSLLFQWANIVLSPNSKIFIEWPSPHTLSLPKASDLKMPPNLLRPQTLNFYDDESHVRPVLPDNVISSANDYGFNLSARGYVVNDYAADLMRNSAVNSDNPFYITVAVWLKTYFSTYMVFAR